VAQVIGISVANQSQRTRNKNRNKKERNEPMNTHPNHTAVVEALKALPAYTDPQTFFESELAECYSDDELVEQFGWEGDKALTPKQAVKAVKARNEVRNDVYGWIVEEGDRERESALEANARDREEANRCGWLVERNWEAAFPFVPNPEYTDEENRESEFYWWESLSERAAESGSRYAIVDCGAKVSDVIRNGVRVGWECEGGHRSISMEYMTQEEQDELYRSDYED
jgi:hypothetical protein